MLTKERMGQVAISDTELAVVIVTNGYAGVMKYLYMMLSTIIWLGIGYLLTLTVYDVQDEMENGGKVNPNHRLVSTIDQQVYAARFQASRPTLI
jgi:hypothetical protein